MSFEAWLAFAVASAVMLAIPGPTVLLVVSYVLAHGRKTAFATVTGVALGDLTAMTASLIGLGALLAASSSVFMILKWIGGIYLIWLGMRLWRAPLINQRVADNDNLPQQKPIRIFTHAYLVTALNPKSIVFFLAFAPQFMDTTKPSSYQMLAMVATFVVLGVFNATAYALAANAARRLIKRASVQRAVNRTGGTLLIAAGAVTAGYRRIAA